jgi:hypothetical protein
MGKNGGSYDVPTHFLSIGLGVCVYSVDLVDRKSVV